MESAVTAHTKGTVQLKLDQINKTNRQRREKGSKAKAVILVPTPTNSVLKYLVLLLHYLSKLKYF